MIHPKRLASVALTFAVVLACTLPPSAARGAHRGYVDCSPLIEIAGGDDAVMIEVSLSGALLKALTGFDQELSELVGGVESIEALILSIDREGLSEERVARLAEQSRRAIREMADSLKKKGWERVARVRESGSEVQILVLHADEQIEGMVVMVFDQEEDEGQLICANIAGMVDMEAIRQIGESFDIPGLDRLEDE